MVIWLALMLRTSEISCSNADCLDRWRTEACSKALAKSRGSVVKMLAVEYLHRTASLRCAIVFHKTVHAYDNDYAIKIAGNRSSKC
jgi:hypothetical protein